MTYSWDDESLDIVNPDLNLLMSDCPAELTIQSHSLMLDVRRSVQLPLWREGTASRRTQVPVARDARVLRRVQSFQDPAVSSSLGSSGGSFPVLTRVRSFFDFSREDPQALDFKAPNIVSQSEKLCAGGYEEVGNDDDEKAGEEKVGANESPAASGVKKGVDPKSPGDTESKSPDDVDADIKNGGEEAVDVNGSGLGEPVTGRAGAVKVDVSQTIKKIESALEEALNVGSLKIDVRDRIKRIQSAFEGFVPWDSATGRPKGEFRRDQNPVDKVEVGEPREDGVVKLKTSESDDGTDLEQGSSTKETKEEGLGDSNFGDKAQGCTSITSGSTIELNQEHIIQDMKDGRLDTLFEVRWGQADIPSKTAVENPTHSQYDNVVDELDSERIINGIEDGGSCMINNAKVVALSTEVVNLTIPERGSLSADERFIVGMETTGLSALDSLDEMQAVILNFETVNSVVVVGDAFRKLKHIKMHNDMREVEPEECDSATQVQTDGPCNTVASRPMRVQSGALDELKEEAIIKGVKGETPEYPDRFDMVESSGYTAIANIENDASSELNQILEEIRSRQTSRLKLIADVDKVQGGMSWNTATGKSGNLQSDVEANVVHEISPTTVTLNGVNGARANTIWNDVSNAQLDTQIAASSELKLDRVVKETKENGLRNSSLKIDEVHLDAGGESVLSEKDTTDMSRLPSPLSQLLDYRHGSAFTFLNVQDDFPDIGECLLHNGEKVCLLGRKASLAQPALPSLETNLKSLLTPGESWCSQEEQTLQCSGEKQPETRRSKGAINLRRLRLRKSVRPNALEASLAKLSSKPELDAELHPRELSQTVDRLLKDGSRSKSQGSSKRARADSLLQSMSSLRSDVDRTPLNVGQNSSRIDRGDVSTKLAEPSLKQHKLYGGSPLHAVNKIPADSTSVSRLNVESYKNLSEKYRPARFEEVVGQTTVVKSLATSIFRRKVAPLYLFLGPRGTGKTSVARIFAAGLNCISLESKIRPCGSCRECWAILRDMSPYVKIVDASTIRDSTSTKTLIDYSASLVGYKVIIIKGCDLLITEIWTALLYIMEEPPSKLVLIFISTTANRIPHTAISRCKKFHFYNLNDREIVDRLQTLACLEDLELEEGVLSLVASRSNGSIHEAELLLDQLCLVDKRVSVSSVQDLVGLLPDRKLLNLLEYALSADAANTTQTMNEILGSSVEPLLLVSQLGILITNILVENFDEHEGPRNSGYFRPSFGNKKIQQRLRQALNILSEAEKYLRVSSDSLTWLTAALLQCSSDRQFPPSILGSLTCTPIMSKNGRQGLERLVSADFGTAEFGPHPTEVAEGVEVAAGQTRDGHRHRVSKRSEPSSSTVEPQNNLVMFEREFKEVSARKSRKAGACTHAANKLNSQETLKAEEIQVFEERDSIQLWNRVLQELTSRNLKHLLLTQGRLVSAGVASDESSAIVEIEFQYASDKHKAERSWRSICSGFESVLSLPIELRISLMKDVFDEALLPRNLEGVDDEEHSLLIQHKSRLKQETAVACYSTDSHVGPHSKRRRRRARRDWEPKEIVAQELESRSRSETGSVPGTMQPPHSRNGSIARPIGEWHTNGLDSSISESVEQKSGSREIDQLGLTIGAKGRRPRLSTMLDAAKSDTDDNQDTQSDATKQKVEFWTDRGLPLDAFCYPCTQSVTKIRRDPTRDVDQFQSGRERDLGSEQMNGRGSAQRQPFFLKLVPCKSISTVRSSKVQRQRQKI